MLYGLGGTCTYLSWAVLVRRSAQEDLEKEACFILGLLAVKPEYQARIAQRGALQGLVRLLREHRSTALARLQPGSGGAVRRAADAITNLAHENVEIKNMVCCCCFQGQSL